MPEYTVMAALGLLTVVILELAVLRTGIFRKGTYWVAMVIVVFFQCLVDGWLTKLSAPVVLYDGRQILGVRVPWDIPIEDFAFGVAMVTLTLMLWLRATESSRSRSGREER